MKIPVTVILAVKNEGPNLRRCLQALAPAEKIYMIDSHSSDATADIADEYGIEVIQFQYRGGYPKKRQWATDHLPITTEWIFYIDGDEVVPPSLWEEIRAELVTHEGRNADAYLINKGFHFMGKKFRFGGFSHRAVLLFRKGMGRFESLGHFGAGGMDMEVHERLIISGRIKSLHTPIIHEDFKGLNAYIQRHNQYSCWEAGIRYQFLKDGRYGEETIRPRLFGNAQEQRRFLKKIIMRLPFEPQLWFLFHFIWKLGFLEGRRGLVAAQIRSAYIAQTRAKIYELKLKEEHQPLPALQLKTQALS